LEAYVLGDLSADEQREVEKNLAQYPQLREELTRIEKVQEAFLMAGAIQPRASVKEGLFNKLESKQRAKVISVSDSQLSFWKYAAAASVVLALVSSYLAYTYYMKWRITESSLSELVAQNQQIAQDYNIVNQRLDQIEKDIQVINNPAFIRVVMKGTENAPEAMASVYWNAHTKEVYLSIQNMKSLARENQYQLWAIVNGKPVDAGVFDTPASGLLKMKELPEATAFAITIEPRGGKATPSLETLQVIGNVVKG
jgi:anti-sigma-K factor RskA